MHYCIQDSSKMYNSSILAVIMAMLAFFTSPANALKFGVGDGLAIVLFVVIAVIATCALLGWISRKRGGG